MPQARGSIRQRVRNSILYPGEAGWPIQQVFAPSPRGMSRLRISAPALSSSDLTSVSASTRTVYTLKKKVVLFARRWMMVLSTNDAIPVMCVSLMERSGNSKSSKECQPYARDWHFLFDHSDYIR